jgi:hypothetical protein
MAFNANRAMVKPMPDFLTIHNPLRWMGSTARLLLNQNAVQGVVSRLPASTKTQHETGDRFIACLGKHPTLKGGGKDMSSIIDVLVRLMGIAFNGLD